MSGKGKQVNVYGGNWQVRCLSTLWAWLRNSEILPKFEGYLFSHSRKVVFSRKALVPLSKLCWESDLIPAMEISVELTIEVSGLSSLLNGETSSLDVIWQRLMCGRKLLPFAMSLGCSLFLLR